eukprot:SAG11_NODE_12040_length_725_cov_0.597444_1_plen_149_part_00
MEFKYPSQISRPHSRSVYYRRTMRTGFRYIPSYLAARARPGERCVSHPGVTFFKLLFSSFSFFPFSPHAVLGLILARARARGTRQQTPSLEICGKGANQAAGRAGVAGPATASATSLWPLRAIGHCAPKCGVWGVTPVEGSAPTPSLL